LVCHTWRPIRSHSAHRPSITAIGRTVP
jgi:hypothetical protein